MISRTALAFALAPALALLASAPALAQDIPILGAVTEEAWVFEAEHFTPRGDFQEAIRDLDGVSLSAMRAWRFSSGLEFQLGGGLFHADGTTTELFSPDPPLENSADGVRAGGRIRYNFPQLGSVRPFVDGYAGVLWTPEQPFPAGGTSVNGMATWGGGVEVAIDDRWAVEAGWRNQHISNGGGLVDYNPAWDSEGAFLSLRRTIGGEKKR